jgi:hypothetical protein
MKKRYLALLCVIALWAFGSIALASGASELMSATAGSEITSPDVCFNHKHPASEQRALAHVVFAGRHWQRAHIGHGRLSEVGALRRCAKPNIRKRMREDWLNEKMRFGRYRKLRQIAPYPGGGEWWVIPYVIVSCESGGSWTAINSSGAVGPYQLLGHGAPYPANTYHEKMENHLIALDLYQEGGTGPWEASESCWG